MYKFTYLQKKEMKKKSLFLYFSPNLALAPLEIFAHVHNTVIVIHTQTNTYNDKLLK